MKCQYCPLKDIEMACISDELNHQAACDSVNPTSSTYNPEMARGVINNSTDLYNKKYHPELIKPPTFAQKVVNLVGAMNRIIEEGHKEVTEEIYHARLSQCAQCEFKTEGWTCSHPSCGCFLAVKAKLTTESCPIGKWGLEFLRSPEVDKIRSVSVDQMMKESVLIAASGGNPGGCGCKGDVTIK